MKTPSFYSVMIECDPFPEELLDDLMENVIGKRQKLYPHSKNIGYCVSGYDGTHYWFGIKTRCIKPCIRKVVGRMKGVNIKSISWNRQTIDSYRKRDLFK